MTTSSDAGKQDLEHALRERDEAGRRWAEHVSHAHPETGHSLLRLVQAELRLSSRWPEEHASTKTRALLRDVGLLHSDRWSSDCSLCTDDAA